MLLERAIRAYFAESRHSGGDARVEGFRVERPSQAPTARVG
jgi:hypothetical protein